MIGLANVVGAPCTAAPSAVSVVLVVRLPRPCGSVIFSTPPFKTALAPTVVSALMALIKSCTVDEAGVLLKLVVPALMILKPVTARFPWPPVSTI